MAESKIIITKDLMDKVIEELTEYRAIGTIEELKRLKALFGNENSEMPEIATKILKEYPEYLCIGTVEEFKALKEDKKFLEFLYNQILPNEMEQYLSMYHTKDKIAVNGYADQSGLMSAT